jgi:hypothetical protein
MHAGGPSPHAGGCPRHAGDLFPQSAQPSPHCCGSPTPLWQATYPIVASHLPHCGKPPTPSYGPTPNASERPRTRATRVPGAIGRAHAPVERSPPTPAGARRSFRSGPRA